ncbi:hypothetical protein HanXRQr2_Chr08g0340521 [Helianthus annuus]|uniref:Uncharacterized protein n=1 Tax=Helianthus annuus TaxID=4232 RepID=A0A9K3IF37_HELAN|nr:hypothetical protein HanXRQr2_Chr08g0340521 [Helianthus annuus]
MESIKPYHIILSLPSGSGCVLFWVLFIEGRFSVVSRNQLLGQL